MSAVEKTRSLFFSAWNLLLRPSFDSFAAAIRCFLLQTIWLVQNDPRSFAAASIFTVVEGVAGQRISLCRGLVDVYLEGYLLMSKG